MCHFLEPNLKHKGTQSEKGVTVLIWQLLFELQCDGTVKKRREILFAA